MSPPESTQNPIATPEALRLCLKTSGLEALAEPLIAEGLLGADLFVFLDIDNNSAVWQRLADTAGENAPYRIFFELQKLQRNTPTLTIAMTDAELQQGAEMCRCLGQDWHSQTWLLSVIATWPGPNAHEIQVLSGLLAQGQAFGALWQLRDVAEVLIKIPTVILVSSALAYGTNPEQQQHIHSVLFSGKPSMGTWLDLLRKLAKDQAEHPHHPFAANIADWFFTGKAAKQTPFAQTLEALVAMRNNEFGHGARRFNETEVVDVLRHYLLGDLTSQRVKQLGLNANTALSKGLSFVHDLQPWQHLHLVVQGQQHDYGLVGAQSLIDHHQALPKHTDAEHPDHTAALVLTDGTDRLDLSPYLSARVCSVCGYRDVFLFNGWDKKQRRFDLLDYQIGHRMRKPWHKVPDFHREVARHTHTIHNQPEPEGDLLLSRASVEALLDDIALDKRYLSPDYLRDPLRHFLSTQARGIFWLQAPADIDKTHFVLGLG